MDRPRTRMPMGEPFINDNPFGFNGLLPAKLNSTKALIFRLVLFCN